MREIKNDPQVVEFVRLMEKKNFSELNNMLKKGFNPNSTYERWESFSYDNGAIYGGSAIVSYRMIELPIVKICPALKKLLEKKKKKTKEQEEWEKYQAERAAEEAEVDRLLNE